MPIYEYRCQRCGQEFEAWQKITDPTTTKCEACGGTASRLISHSTFVLKGTGWYVTDYARKQSSAPAVTTKKDSGSESGSSKSATSESS